MALLKSGLNPAQPVTMAEAPGGELYIANGLDAPLRWDGRTAECENAGIDVPATGCAVGSSGSGTIYGEYKIYVRYLDDDDIPSNLSTSTSITITSGAKISQFDYSSIPVSGDSRVTQRQLWRNTDGQEVTWYLDATVADNTSTTANSTKTDGTLITQTALRYLTEDGYPNAMRFVPPPHHMGVVCSYRDRMWYSVPTDYTEGEISSVSGTTVTANGAIFGADMVGRNFLVAGLKAGVVDSQTTSVLTLSTSQGAGFGTANQWYAVSPEDDERNKIYFSEINEPESIPDVNVMRLQHDGDFLTGMMPLYSYLYLFKEAHVYRLATAGDPRKDASISLVAERGLLNQRCWCRAEGLAFILDRGGVYAFDGQSTQPLSGPIQDYFRGTINWPRAKWFHAEASPQEEVVRFFVCLDSDIWPQNAICYHYRLNTWWVEEYPFDIGASTISHMASERRLIAGADEDVMLMNEGPLDGCAPYASMHDDSLVSVSQDLRGTLTGATTTTVTDTAADFDFSSWLVAPTDIGAPIYVIDSNGDSQSNRIASIQTTTKVITVQEDWGTTPSVGDTYQIGGIAYQAKFGAFNFVEEEQDNPRRWHLKFEPLSQAATVNLRRYLNHSDTEETAGYTGTNQDGATWVKGSDNIVVDLTQTLGHVQHSFDDGFEGRGPADRVMEVELKGVSGQEKPKIYGLDLDGVEA